MAKIVIDSNKCKGCELCTTVCPHNLIVMSEELNPAGFRPASFIPSDECSGCTFCAVICPDIAIEVFK
ncbi:MAG: 4Fe-4S binding protein [bacterium]|nr:4Fe-4S binding protein [bacterium]